MRKLILAAGVAALAISAPSAAKPDGDRGGGKAKAEKSERGGGKSRADRPERRSKARAERPERRSKASADRSERRSKARSERRGENRLAAMRAQARDERRGRDNDRARAKRDRDNDRRVQVRRDRNEDRRRVVQRDRNDDRRQVRRDRDDDRVRVVRRDRDDDRVRIVRRDRDRDVVRFRDFDDDRRRFASRGIPAAFLDGCPPGLRSKNELCLPPGQYKKSVGRRLPVSYSSHVLPLGLRDLYRDSDDYYYRYGDGYLYQVDRDRDLISSILPLIGAGLGIGMQFPYSSPNYYVPTSYRPFYPDSQYSYHRYANGYVYEIDRSSGLIEDMIPFLGGGYGIGQMMPASYSYYNVPYQYRDWYQDDDDYYYRYAPGAIYQVDRDSQLITAIASLLMGGNGLSVGQPLPMSYSAYNVPFDYRDRYYDTPDNWYRYANGHIYQVDPTTRLITAMIDAIA